MIRKFLQGLCFGAGFAVAFITIWYVASIMLVPRILESAQKEPLFDNPRSAEVIEPGAPQVAGESRDFSFFKDSEHRMKIPEGSGILSMSPAPTEQGAARPNTYQLWLTESELWQIRTIGEQVEVEKRKLPDDTSVDILHSLMIRQLGTAAQQSMMTVSEREIRSLKSGGSGWRGETLNGKMRITTDGVVFVMPAPYEE